MEQWAADIAAPREPRGVRCLAQGSHLSCGLPARAGIRTHNLGLLRVSSPTLYPLGHDCPVFERRTRKKGKRKFGKRKERERGKRKERERGKRKERKKEVWEEERRKKGRLERGKKGKKGSLKGGKKEK